MKYHFPGLRTDVGSSSRRHPIQRLLATAASALACILLAFQVAAQASSPARAGDAWLDGHPVITVGVHEHGWPPFEDWNGGAPRGLAIDYLDEATSSLGVRLRFLPFDSWTSLLKSACDGDIDLIMNVVITAERTECLIFTRQYAQTLVAVVGREGDARPAESMSLKGLRIVTERDFATVDAVASRYPDAIHLHVDDTLQALRAVADGSADVYVGNAHVASHLMSTDRIAGIALIRTSDLSLGALHFAVPNKNRALAEAINTAMQEIPDARRNAIEIKWLPELEWVDSEQGVMFSTTEQAALKNTLRLGSPPPLAPLYFEDPSGKPMGLLTEYVARFQDAGARLVHIPSASWRDAREAMRSNKVDAAVTLMDASEPLSGWTYSQPITSIPNVIVIRSDARDSVLALRDLSGHRVALSDPERLIPLIAPSMRDATFIEAVSTRQGMELVRQREADAYVGNLAAVDALVQSRFAGTLRVSAPVDIEDRFVFAARGEHAAAVSAFDRMLAAMPQREREAIRGDWLSFEYRSDIDWRRALRWIVPTLAILVSILLLQARSNRRLRLEMNARRRLETRFAEVTSHLPAVIYQTTRSTTGEYGFPYVVGDLRALFGISNEEAMASGDKLMARVHIDDRPRLTEAIQRTMAENTLLDIEFRALSDQGWRWIRSASRPYTHEGGLRYWTGYWIDVTDQHNQRRDLMAAKAAAEEATRAKANFLATMSHEIRTPMSGVIGLLEMLSHTPLDQEQRKIVGTIDDSAQMLKQILDDILDISKMEAGALTLESSPLCLRSIVDAVVQMLAPLASNKGLKLESHMDFRIAQYHLGDDIRLRQVLFNLVSNAIKFTESGRVAIQASLHQASETHQTIQLSVADTGIGIPEERQAVLFKPFAQADASTTRRYGGTGLGLSICARIVTQMGGSIRLHSKVGTGTTVLAQIAFQVAESLEEEAGGRGRHAALRLPWVDTTARILIAEDHPTNRVLMAWYMQQLGLAFDMVENGRDALRALESSHYDLLITDCLMPVMSGYELAGELRRREQEVGTARLPILAITANVYQGEIERCRAAGMDAYLAKPVLLDAIAAAIRELLDVALPRAGAGSGPAREGASLDVADRGILTDLVQRYGSRATALAMLASLRDTTHADIERLRGLPADAGAQQAALLHRIAGALSAVSQMSLAAEAKVLERRLADGSDPKDLEFDSFLSRLEVLLADVDRCLASVGPH